MLRILQLFLVFLVAEDSIQAQQVLLVQKYACAYPETQLENLLINGMENEISILLEGVYCDSFRLIADSCTIKKEGCNFIVKPDLINGDPYDTTIRKMNFFLHSKYGIDTLLFGVMMAPVPFFYVHAMESRHGFYPNYGLDSLKSSISCFSQARVKSFCYEWIRGDSVLEQGCNDSNSFSKEQNHRFVNGRRLGDYIVLKNIVYEINGVEHILSPIYFMREVNH